VDSGEGFGNFIIINHGRDIFQKLLFFSICPSFGSKCSENQLVSKGEVIGVTGQSGPENTAPHLHFELITSIKILLI